MKHKLEYRGIVVEIFKIWILNILLKICTLGIYGFWGKTRVRHYIVGHTYLLGDAFEYSGTGKELFLGFLKVLPFLLILYSPLFWFGFKQENNFNIQELYLIFLSLVIFFLFHLAIYASIAYRLSRTKWRGIRGHLAGSGFEYALLASLQTILNVVTLGFWIPFADVIKMRYRLNRVYYGNQKAIFSGKGSELFLSHIITAILMIPTLGFSRFWYQAALERYRFKHLKLGSLHFDCRFTGLSLLGLELINGLILILTAGFGRPFVIQRRLKYMVKHIVIIGDLATLDVQQSQAPIQKSGEGFIAAFDIDNGFF